MGHIYIKKKSSLFTCNSSVTRRPVFLFANPGNPICKECGNAAASEASLPFFGPLLHEQRQIEVCESPPHQSADKHDER